MFTKEERSTFPYWFAHWCSYNMTALNLGVWRYKYLFHDIEKPFLRLFLPYSKVQKYHRKHHNHHFDWLERMLWAYEYMLTPKKINELLDEYDYEGNVIDWECNRFTKLEQPRNAEKEYYYQLYDNDFSYKYPLIYEHCYSEFTKRLYKTIEKLGLNTK